MNKKKKVVIFDIGGVIASDVWEPMFLDSVEGISAKYSVPSARARLVGESLWNKYSVISGDPFALESLYWREVISLLELPLSVDYCIKWSEEFIRPVDGVGELVDELLLNGVAVAVCSNNTEFWFLRQYKKINCLRNIGRGNMALSFEVGETKDSCPSRMFAVADEKAAVSPGLNIIYVDDREKNVSAAKRHGYSPVFFESAHGLRILFQEKKYI